MNVTELVSPAEAPKLMRAPDSNCQPAVILISMHSTLLPALLEGVSYLFCKHEYAQR